MSLGVKASPGASVLPYLRYSTLRFILTFTPLFVFKTVSAIKLKWKGLRDTFRKHFKISRDGSRREAGADETRGTTWKFFKHMLFLSDVVDVGW